MIREIKYIDLCSEMPDDVAIEFDKWATKDEPHNNGYARWWHVEEQNEAAYPAINKYLLDQGLSVGDKVLVHSSW